MCVLFGAQALRAEEAMDDHSAGGDSDADSYAAAGHTPAEDYAGLAGFAHHESNQVKSRAGQGRRSSCRRLSFSRLRRVALDGGE